MYHKFYRNLASINADNEAFCTVLLTSQVIMIQGFQPKGRELDIPYVLVLFCFCSFLPLFDMFLFCFVFVLFYPYSIRFITFITFIVDVPRPRSNVLWIIVFQKVDA